MTARNLREQRAAVWSQMQEIRDAVDKDGWTAELREQWDRADGDFSTLTADIERDERSAALDSSLAEIDEATRHVDAEGRETRSAGDQYREAFGKWIRGGNDALDAEQRQLMQQNFAQFAQFDQRAQAAVGGSAGGYTVPEGFWAKVTETLKYYGGIEAAGAEVLTTDSGNTVPWPTNDDTSNTGVILSENTQETEQALSFGQKSLGAWMYSSRLILASFQFLQDTGIDAESFIARKAGERIGRIQNTHFTTGTATVQPQGLFTGATAGGTCAGSATIAYDDLVNIQHSVDVAYRGTRARWMFHDLIAAHIRKIRDGDGRILWQPSVVQGQPDTLLGYGVVINNDCSSTLASTNKLVGFGDVNAAYAIRRVSGGQLLRLTERYADYLQVGFLGFGRADGVVQDASAFKCLVGKNS